MLGWETPGALVALHSETTLSWNPGQMWVRTGERGRRKLAVAQRSTANCTVDAAALVFTAGLERLPVLVNPAVVLAGASVRLS